MGDSRELFEVHFKVMKSFPKLYSVLTTIRKCTYDFSQTFMISYMLFDLPLKSVCHCTLILSLRLPDTGFLPSEKSDMGINHQLIVARTFLRNCGTCVILQGTVQSSSGLQMIFILFVSRAHILAAMEPKFCTDTTFMFPELPIKFESNRITLTLSKWWLSLKVIKWSFVDDWVIVLDSNFLGSSGNIKVVPVQSLGSIAASIWALEAKRMTIIFTPDELCTVPYLKDLVLEYIVCRSTMISLKTLACIQF